MTIRTTSIIYAAFLNITVKRGDDSLISISFTDPNNGDEAVALHLYSDLKMQIRRAPQDTTVVLELTIGNGLLISGNQMEILNITIPGTDALESDTTYYYDVEGTIDDGNRTILEGTIGVSPDVTRD
jgi:hypothetical protein